MRKITYLLLLILGISFLNSGCNDNKIKRQKEAYEQKKAKKKNQVVAQENFEVKYSKEVIELNDNNFDSYIASGVTLVDFWAVWCRPCKIQGPIVDELAQELGEKVHVCKMNVDSNQKVPSRFGITNIPTIIIFKDGQAVQQLVGLQSKISLSKQLEAYL